MQRIILASGSPRRKEILELLGVEFEVVESYYNEDLIKTEDPVELVEELALQKTLAVAERYPDAIIVGGDTVVVLEGEILGKAGSKEEAKEIFGKLLGKTHQVVTGVAVINSLTGERYGGSEQGEVTLREGKEGELEEYVNNERNWRGFAGAYALQGGAAPFAKEQTGKLSAIIGMPIELTASLLEEAGVIVEVEPKELELSLHGKRVGI
ncbi:MAG: nucleoside triphosphate pyrophosphatase [bacterium]